MPLDRAGLLALCDLEKREVALPGGQTVLVRIMTVAERDRLVSAFKGRDPDEIRPRTIAATVCDAEGHLLYSEADLAEIASLPFPVADAIFDVSAELNKTSAGAQAELGNDSGGTPGSGG